MPELPEVETIKETLKQLIINESIEEVSVHWENIIKRPEEVSHFKKKLIGQTFLDISRKGKFLIFHLDDYDLVSHLRMEGKYSVHPKETPRDKHTHVTFTFTSGNQLRYNDVRKFGTMHLFKKGKYLQKKPINQLAPDPFEKEFTFAYFKKRLQRTKRAIKTVLLDQQIIAGLGNIYVDETLYKAKIHPLKQANTLTDDEIERIQKYAKKILEKAIAQGGTTIRSYVASDGEIGLFQQELYVYGQEDEKCKRCQDTIIKIRVSNRGTHLCPTCQRED